MDIEIEAEEDLYEHDETVWEMMERTRREDAERDRLAGKLPTLKVTEQRGLGPWQPGSSTAPPKLTVAQQAAAAAAGGVVEEEASYSYEELLLQLPGLQRQLRLAAQERAGLPPAEREVDVVYHPDARMDRPLQPPLSEWDLRAKMEKRKRQQREIDAWNQRRARVGQFPSLGTDWRTDLRIQEAGTGDPTDPHYREWTHKEIWDLITLSGRNADPRDVSMFVRNPLEIADAPSQGGSYAMDPEEYFESRGQLIMEDDVAAITGSAGTGASAAGAASGATGGAAGDKDSAEVSLLAAEFSDFDEELAGGDFDADYAAGGGAAGGGDDGDF